MFMRHHTDKLIYPIILLVLVIFISYRPKYRLRPDMPAAFFPVTAAIDKNGIQNRIARGYWESARMDIQWKYAYGHALPADAPPEFRFDAKALGPTACDDATRALYWHRLQQVWSSPEAWKQNYEWDWSWTSDPFTSASEWLHNHADLWLRAHSPN
jgi:hypothetical protein